jgi:tetratricopeptide (TPR) repeat protein
MKKIAVLLIFCFFTLNVVNAQKNEVNRAKRQLSRGNLEQALGHVNNATNDATTQKDPATWILKSKILLEMATSEDATVKNLVATPLEESYQAIQKAQSLDAKNLNILDINQTLLVLSEAFFNSGATAYNENNFKKASDNFLNSFQVSQAYGTTDTSTLYNAGLSAEIGGLFDEAYNIYRQVEEMNYDQPFLYSSLTNITLRNKDFDAAEKWIKKGRERYPDNLELIFAEANVHLTSGNIPEAKNVLELAISKDPYNANLHYAFGVNYDQMSKDSIYSAQDRDFAYNEAIKAYKKAIELKPDYFDAIYNLGALYFNEGIKLFVEADNILRGGYTQANLNKSSQLEDKSKAIWRENAQPYLEESLALLQPNDQNYEIVLRSLRELYMRTGQNEKLEATNAIWNEKFGDRQE